LLGLALLAGCGPAPTATAPTAAGPKPLPTAVVTVAAVQGRTAARAVAAVGTLAGYEEATLAPKVDGRVLAVHADAGDLVYPGQPLLELDTADYRLEVDRARRALDLELAKADLTAMPPEGTPFDPDRVPAVRRATLTLENAKREAERIERTGGVSDRERQAALTEYKVAEAARRQAVSEVKAVIAAARLRQVELEQAQQRLADATLAAPVPAGWAAWAAAVGPAGAPLRYAVAQRLLSEGEMVRAMPVTNAFKLVIAHALKLKAAVPERFGPEVRVGQAVDVTVEAYPGAAFAGRVARVNPTVDPLNRTFQVEVAVPNLDGRLKPGGFARAAVKTRTEAIKTVPAEAVVTFAGVTKVFVVEGDTARAVEVRVGDREKEWLEVVGDLPVGASVATSGFSQLADGSPVRLRDAETAKR
jgi:multidrug efflux pump subunit AcrA (membrane-fusion protein)